MSRGRLFPDGRLSPNRWQNHGVDSEVLARFVNGDRGAVDELYAEYKGPVYTVAVSILRDRELAADATQQTFLKAWRAAENFDLTRPFAPWIYSIARRTAIDIWRSESRRVQTPLDQGAEIVDLPPGLEHAWERFEVRRALASLSEEEREVVRMAHFNGYTHSQIAELLEVSIGTVKSRSHRAHRKLAASLIHLIQQ